MKPARPARYFPVTTTPLAMRAGLQPFGTDFGNGARDGHFFQRDDELGRYLDAKARVSASRHAILEEEPEHARAHDVVLAWMRETLAKEHGLSLPELDDERAPRRARWEAVNGAVQEDLALLHRGKDDAGVGIGMFVSFPSGWRPERLVGASFHGIHVPVPRFADKPLAAQSMVRAMVERGPYVRFVWTVSADDVLDHHPEEGLRAPLASAERGFLRVERQITVPFPEVGASLFLIRTLLTPFSELPSEQRAVLREALSVMPDEIARYKSLYDGRARVLELLDALA